MFDKEIMEKATELMQKNFEMDNQIPQGVYVIEEMAELTKEISKSYRGKGDIEHIKEEIADVLNAIITYSMDSNIDFNEIKDIMIEKFNRGINRTDKGEF